MPTILRRVAPAAAAVTTACALTLAAGGAAHAATVNYVALGDSYSSGVGSGSYTSSSGSCDRSTKAYSQLWTNANAPSSFTFVACSGATTSDVLSSQISALSSSTTLVSITIGGNDVGFSGVMETCVLDSTASCVSAVTNAESEAQTQLPAKLDAVYAKIKSLSPNARVVVLDYPEFYDLSKSSTCIGLSTTDRTDLNQAADILDGVIKTEAAKYGGFVFGDVRSAFSGHEICDSSSWLHSVNILDIGESYHPTSSGQVGAFLPVFSSNAS
jgi:lysophospholipase L1-like esterase